MFVMVDCVRKMAAKKSCKCGECWSFEHLLFLFLCFKRMPVKEDLGRWGGGGGGMH